MIQRVQTIFLLLISICMGLVLSAYIWVEKIEAADRVVTFTAFSINVIDVKGDISNIDNHEIIESTSTWYIAALAILSSLTALFSVFQFKNRLNQMKLGALNSLFMVATVGLSYYHISEAEKLFPETIGGISLTFYLPVAAMLLNMIANRFIRRDEKLVKSVDRIR